MEFGILYWHYGPEDNKPTNRNEYQEYFLGVRGGRHVGLTTLPLHVPIVMKLGAPMSWNPQRLSRSLLDCFALYGITEKFIVCSDIYKDAKFTVCRILNIKHGGM
jgi:hypothetical protein